MARYKDADCRLCRREGMKLFLKGNRCEMAKCPIERSRPAPGLHGARRRKLSPYAEQFREKQRLRRMYGVLEEQFRIIFRRAQRKKGITGDNLLILLETRLDNTLFRLGFATSRSQARQMIGHGHILVDNHKVDIPSYQLGTGQVVSIRDKENSRKVLAGIVEETEKREVPSWLSVDRNGFKGEVLRMPEREDINVPVNEQLVVELYSK